MGQKLRLVCPNCEAQYEVDESVIPEAGRDVQCSNCGNTWWQLRTEPVSDDAPAEAEQPAPARAVVEAPQEPPSPVAAADDDRAGAPAEDDAAAEEDIPEFWDEEEGSHPPPGSDGELPQPEAEAPAARRDDVAADEADDAALAAMASAPPAPLPTRRSLDDAVLDVLRQEAERETEVRRAEGTAPAAPPPPEMADLGRGSGEREAEVRARMSSLGRLAGGPDPDGSAGRARGDELPDIAEINSSWDGKTEAPSAASDSAAALARRRSGFRAGFGLTLLAAAALAAIYLYSDAIVARAPGLEPQIASYRTTVDRARLWLDSAALNASAALQGELRNE